MVSTRNPPNWLTDFFHATMLYCLGIDQKKLTYRFEGRDYRLTDVAGEIVKKLLV